MRRPRRSTTPEEAEAATRAAIAATPAHELHLHGIATTSTLILWRNYLSGSAERLASCHNLTALTAAAAAALAAATEDRAKRQATAPKRKPAKERKKGKAA